jgi:hypothetical protein
MRELRPLLLAAKSSNWDEICATLLGKAGLTNTIKIFMSQDKKKLKQRQFLNAIYKRIICLKDHSTLTCVDTLSMLILSPSNMGTNFMVVDYYFTFLICVHQFSLNRHDLS